MFQLLDELSRELDELRKYKALADSQRSNMQVSMQANVETHGMRKRDLETLCVNLKHVRYWYYFIIIYLINYKIVYMNMYFGLNICMDGIL